jgi:hypothetical protein
VRGRARSFEALRFSQLLVLLYRDLPEAIEELADKNFELLKANPSHRPLGFKKVGKYRAVRVGLHYRALATEAGDDLLWIWIGTHSEYDKLVG